MNIILKVSKAFNKDGKSFNAGDMIVSKEGAFFFEINNNKVELIKERVSYDLGSERYKKIESEEYKTILNSTDNEKIEYISKLEAMVEELKAKNAELEKMVSEKPDSTEKNTVEAKGKK